MNLERHDQAVFIAWLRDIAALRWPEYCIPGVGFPFVVSHSAGQRLGRGIGWAKQQGLQRGIPDIHIPIPRGNFGGLWIELKRSEGRAVLSKAQREWIGWLNMHGFCARVCHGADEAIKLTEDYLQRRV